MSTIKFKNGGLVDTPEIKVKEGVVTTTPRVKTTRFNNHQRSLIRKAYNAIKGEKPTRVKLTK